MDLRQLGAVVTKTITLKPRQGNPPPRTCETPAGMLNSIGLENPGIEVFLKEKLPLLKKIGIPVIVSIASEGGQGEFVELARRLAKIREVAAVELNISCPNIRGKPLLISQNAKSTYELTMAVRRVIKKTLIVKLSPNVTDIAEIAQAAQAGGSDAVSLINTLVGMSIDTEKFQPKLAAVTGGLSGPAIRPIAVRIVWEVYKKIKIPIIGMGGIINTSDAVEFFLAGATAVSVGTANFINPRATIEIIQGLKDYLAKNKFKSIRQVIGKLKT
jgi:dihydroorotate dehydrogenase (NAD+) catalytic subunit